VCLNREFRIKNEKIKKIEETAILVSTVESPVDSISQSPNPQSAVGIKPIG
jgi:hypothetical protein